MEHASFLTPQGPQPDPRVIEALAASGTFVSACIPGTVPGIPPYESGQPSGTNNGPGSGTDEVVLLYLRPRA